MSERRAVLLDFGGTLDSEGKHWSTQFADSYAAAGLRARRDELDAAFIAVDREVSADPAAATLPFSDYVLEYARRIVGRLDSSIEDRNGRAAALAEHFLHRAIECLHRNASLLEGLRSRFRFAIVSNFTANLPLIVEEVGLGRCFEEIVCSAIEGVRKPDPAMFQRAIDRLGVNAADVTMIGDSLGNDIQPAKSLGLTTVWLRGDSDFSGGRPSAADHIVTTMAEAFSLLSPAPTVRAL